MQTPLSLPRRYIWVAAGALGAAAVMYFRNRRARDEGEDPWNPPKRDRDEPARPHREEPAAAPKPADDKPADAAKADGNGAAQQPPPPADDGAPGGARELSEFLSGDSWFDEAGWRGIWDREGVEDASAWLRGDGRDVLSKERKALSDHPALLAGCRRRWIVVCRYGGIDVSDAAALWNESE
jgi:hypothetical protein